jgi:diguanylate cyclase (GGDEF)-like protein
MTVHPDEATRALERARSVYYERPAAALAVASSCHEIGWARSDAALCARAKALQAAISVHRGDVRGALALAVEAERHADATDDLAARAEAAAVTGQVGFFAGSSAAALGSAERAVRLADESGDLSLRIYVRRATCLVFGNLGVRDLEQRVRGLLALTLEAGDRWEEAISRNDLACFLQESDPPEAAAEIARALASASAAGPDNRFALGIVYSTRADILLATGRPAAALEDARRAIRLLTTETDGTSSGGEPNPYVLAVTIRAEVQAQLALGQLDGARAAGEDALRWLGDRVPQIRSLILTTLARELRAAGLVEEAYDALERAAVLERQAFDELSELRLGLERARTEAEAAREQADRDWLTGLHNRRYLARAINGPHADRLGAPLALAVLDLDHFKSINDRFGHDAGDQVLVRVARLLSDVLREDDIVVRSGGEEFLILMPATAPQAATAVCERIRHAIDGEDWAVIGDGLDVTASIGVAAAAAPGELEAAARRADGCLYEAKRRGRGRVVGELTDEARATGAGTPGPGT